MKARWNWGAYAVSLLLGASIAPAAIAFVDAGSSSAARPLAGGDNAARERVIDAVQRRFNAKVVRVAETNVNGRPALELRLLSNQRVWNVVVDAESGQVLSGR